MRKSRPEPSRGVQVSPTTFFTIRKPDKRISFAHQVRIKPAPKLLIPCGHLIRAISTECGTSELTDIEACTGIVERRIPRLPPIHRLWAHASGNALAYSKAARLGSPSHLLFLSLAGEVYSQATLPDAIGQALAVPEGWYVGCRNGSVHAFAVDGTRLWCWTRDWQSDEPFRDSTYCYTSHPYLWLAPWSCWLAVIERRTIYVLDHAGQEHCHTLIPREDAERPQLPGLLAPAEAVERLMAAGASRECLHVGVIRLEASSSPAEFHPNLFRRTLQCGMADDNEAPHSRWDVYGVDRVATTAVAGTRDRLMVGTNSGRVHIFDPSLRLIATLRLAPARVSCIVSSNEQLIAAYGGGQLALISGDQIRKSVQTAEQEANLAFCGDHLLVWKRHRLWMVDAAGDVFWSVDFRYPMVGALVVDDKCWISARTLTCFRRHIRAKHDRARTRA